MSQQTDLIRLNKYIAQCGISSRRGADDLIAAGQVQVNGEIPQPGQKIDPAHDVVLVHGKPVQARNRDITLALHKPIEVVTTLWDPQDRETVYDLLPPEISKLRPVPVGRLDYYSEGLLLMTTDGELCNRLTHPSRHQPKTYHVRVRGKMPDTALQAMRKGMTLREGEKLAPAMVKVINVQAGNALLEMVLHQGFNRQIRRMCRDHGLTVLKLSRVQQATVKLDDLPVGRWRELTNQELSALKKAVGM